MVDEGKEGYVPWDSRAKSMNAHNNLIRKFLILRIDVFMY